MLCYGHRVGEDGKTVVSRDGGCTLANVVKKVGSIMVSIAAQRLEVAMLCRVGLAEPIFWRYRKRRRSNCGAPRTPHGCTLTLTKVLPEVQVRRWRRPSGRGFMT